MKIAFYTGPDCHLCALADEVLAGTRQYSQLDIEKYNIREDTELYHRYAVRIPVIQRKDTGEELGWPFDVKQAEQFLA